MWFSCDSEARPKSFGGFNASTRDLGIARKKMIGEVQAEIFRRFDRMQLGHSIDGVLHRVCGQYFAIVTFAVRRFEVAFEADADGEFLDVVSIRVPRELQDADVLLAVIIFAKPDGHWSAPAIRGISKRAQQQRNVIVLLRV